MKIAVLGTGMVGRALSAKLTALGHKVAIGTRDVENTLSERESDFYGNPPFSNWQNENPGVDLQTFSNAAMSAEILFLCTPGAVAMRVAALAGAESLRGKVLIDITNGLVFSDENSSPSLQPVNTDSVAEQLQRKFPAAKVVKAMNTIDHELMINPTFLEGNHSVFLCGDDQAAKDLTEKILKGFGWKTDQIIDLGSLVQARAMEMHALLWWRLYQILGTPKFNIEIRRLA